MFSLDDTMRYWLYNKPVNMRMGFNGLSGIVNNNMWMNIRSSNAHDIDVCAWLKDSIERIPTEKDLDQTTL